VKQEDYGDRFPDHLLEQYKLFVEMADRVSARRGQTNRFYITLLTGILVLLSAVVNTDLFCEIQTFMLLVVSILSLMLCLVWYMNIYSYRQLNSCKFKVIHEMENQLPFSCYDVEWDFLGRGKDSNRYRQLTRVEQYVPVILAVPYILIVLYIISVLLISNYST